CRAHPDTSARGVEMATAPNFGIPPFTPCFQAEDGIRDWSVTGVQTCALPISHPGIAHYITHAYDYPPLAPRALDAARRYAKIAPDSPHALHMPSHIFTRLGLWQESIASNLVSAA